MAANTMAAMTKPGDTVMTHSAWLNTHPKDREYARRIEAAQKANGYKPYQAARDKVPF